MDGTTSLIIKSHECAMVIAIEQDRIDYLSIDRIKRLASSAKAMAFHRSLILDMGRVQMISSMILSSLIDLMRQLGELGQRLILVGMNASVRRAFTNTRLDHFFEIHSDADTALQKLAKPARA